VRGEEKNGIYLHTFLSIRLDLEIETYENKSQENQDVANLFYKELLRIIRFKKISQ
jgi:hypothetical protein